MHAYAHLMTGDTAKRWPCQMLTGVLVPQAEGWQRHHDNVAKPLVEKAKMLIGQVKQECWREAARATRAELYNERLQSDLATLQAQVCRVCTQNMQWSQSADRHRIVLYDENKIQTHS